MLERGYQILNNILGLDIQLLNFWHMVLRGVIVFLLGIFIAKINRRFIGQRTDFNFILFIMLGSILATGITGNAPFFAVLGMAIVLLILNWLLVKASFYCFPIEKMLKGEAAVIIKKGELQSSSMSRYSITKNDLLMQLRLQHGSNNLENIEMAYIEPNGGISFILKNQGSRQL
jgi:uncharacterized membrane protein YcaP (DUF421 family)